MKVLSNRRWLGAAILAWTLLAWGGRVTLLTVGDDWLDWVRIGGSVVVGVAVGLVLLLSPVGTQLKPWLYGFAGWTAVIWTRSMIVNWAGSGALGFKVVHTVLALGFALLIWWAVAFARGNLVSGPDQADREEQRDPEPGRIT
jgi:hypothetical protein